MGPRERAAGPLLREPVRAVMVAQNKRGVRDRDAGLIGQLAGEYRIVRKLGAGGFGTVYEAEHPLLKRKAAVKVLHFNPAMESVTAKRFIEEARSASQIRHRHIVDIFSFGTLPNGQYFYVMDLLEGAPLDRYLEQQGKLAPELALPLLRSIANAVDALHAASIVHRDLKPANIFLAWETNGEVVPKLLDFGLIKLLGKASLNTANGVPLGTPYYMSPEQCRGDAVDARSDVYAFGVICHELLTGTVPFPGDSAASVLVAHLVKPPPRMTEVCPELSTDLDAPVLRMLSKDPAARPSSAGAALNELERAAHGAGVSLGEGLPWLPRPAVEASTAAFSETPAEPDRSGTRTGPRSTGPSAQQRSRLAGRAALGLVLFALVSAAVYTFARSRSPVAPAQVLPPPSARPPQVAPAETPTPEAQAVPPPAPASPEQVSLTLRGVPAGAAVLLDDRKLGEAPGPVPLPRGEQPLSLKIVGPGYGPRTLRVTPSAPLEVELPPERPARAQPKRPPLPRDLEDPF